MINIENVVWSDAVLKEREGRMKKIKVFRGMVIAQNGNERFYIFIKDEWSMGEGYRYHEWDCGSIKECEEWIKSE